jgi:predicted permease
LGSLPGVASTGLVNTLPFSTSNETMPLTIDGAARPEGEASRAGLRLVSEGYFAALGRRIVEGRGLRLSDGASGSPSVVVNRALARRHFDGDSPLGRVIRLSDRETGHSGTIVGLVTDVQHSVLSEVATPEVYVHYSHDPRLTMSAVVRTDGDPAALAAAVRAEAAAIDLTVPLYDMQTMSRMVENSFLAEHMASSALVVFGVSALVLTALGLHGLVAFMVGQRAREIGVRVALGAPRRSVMNLVLRQSLQLAMVGLVLGLGLAAMAARGLSSLLFGVGPGDPLTYLGAVLVIGTVTLVASWMPARRALGVDPVTALRE